jgi:hypothetical protein
VYPIGSVNDSSNLAALYSSTFALYFLTAWFTLWFNESVGLTYTFSVKSILDSS